MENGNKLERSEWFSDIEPLFKLLSYENVPPYLKVCMVVKNNNTFMCNLEKLT